MIDPFYVIVLGVLITLCGACIVVNRKSFFWVFIGGLLVTFLLTAISYSAGYPTNASFPAHAIVYGLTADHVWAAPKEDPYPPRGYIFRAPPEWHEERDKRKGQPFEVEKVGEGEETRPGANPSDRTSEGPYVIHQHILPPKDE